MLRDFFFLSFSFIVFCFDAFSIHKKIYHSQLMTAFIGSQEKKLKDGRNGNIRHQNGTNGVMSNGVSPNSKFAKGEQVRLVWDVDVFVISNFLLDFRVLL